MAVVINYKIASTQVEDLAVSEGASIGELREILSVAGHPVEGCSIRLYRGKNPEEVYIGHLDDFILTADDTVVFYDGCTNVTVEADSTITIDKKTNETGRDPETTKRLKEILTHLDAAAQIIINNL